MSATRATASDVVRVTLRSMATAYSAGRMPSDGRMKRRSARRSRRAPAPRSARQTTERGGACGGRAAAGCEYGAPSQPIGEHLLVVPVPIALEHLGRIVAPLEAQKLGHLRVARLDLPAGCPSVVGGKVAAGKFDCAIDQPAEVVGGLAPAVLVVIHVQVHDGADPRLARPGEEALVVLLDEADRSVDELRTVLPQIRPHGGKERGERGAWHIELADHFRAFHLGL